MGVASGAWIFHLAYRVSNWSAYFSIALKKKKEIFLSYCVKNKFQLAATNNFARIRGKYIFSDPIFCIFSNVVLSMYLLKDSFVYPHSAYRDSGMMFQIFCSLFIVTRYDVGKHLNLGQSGVITTCILWTTDFLLVEHSTSCCYTVLMRANQLETAVHGCIFDFRFGLSPVVVVVSFLHSIRLAHFTYKINDLHKYLKARVTSSDRM